MKKVILLILLVGLVHLGQAQNEVIKFLEIPVDGTKSAMIQKLREKGFVYNANKDCLTGEFNGANVDIFIVTNNNKVYRIMVADVSYISETDNNNLCRQFAKNDKYVQASLLEDYMLPEDEDIDYNMSIKHKRYQASYYQISPNSPAISDTAQIEQEFLEISAKYGGKEQIANLPEEQRMKLMLEMLSDYVDKKFSNNVVWFMIDRYYTKYRILMYYDNKYNQADGEDL